MWNMLVETIFPPPCLGCRRHDAWFCPSCMSTVVTGWEHGPRCSRCDRVLAGSACSACRGEAPDLAGIRIAGTYSAPLKTAILAFKFERKRRAAERLGWALARTWEARPGGPIDCIVTVPMPADRLRERGFNQSALLAEVAARELHRPFLPEAIRRTRIAPKQHDLHAHQRRTNVVGLFAADGPRAERIAGKRILIIDDIVTTGATVNAIALAVLAAGAVNAWGLALARPDLAP